MGEWRRGGGRRCRATAAAIGLQALVLLLAAAPLAAQLSPGPLSRAHAGLEGSANCLKCHQTGKGVAPERCLACHTPLRQRIAAGKGLHARPDHRRCQTCHNEHHGREFELIFWGPRGQAGFQHALTGFRLEGAHAKQACRTCHRPQLVREPATLKAGNANPSRTFLGLGSTCLSCHRDEHRGQFAAGSCLTCHDMAAWRPPGRFDHSRTDFPLTGRHAAVTCASCHPAQSAPKAPPADRTFLKLAGIAHARCTDCHRDPHQGRFGATCQDCHSTAGWRQVDRARFDHDRTDFPLTGRHRAVACASCHKPRPGGRELAFAGVAHARCTDCHEDPHQGRLGATCQSCHSTAGWRQVASARFDHEKTRFPLRGEHREVACRECHPPGQPLARGRFERCADCHRDIHVGQFAARAGGGACEGCHTVEGFSPSTFPLAAHQKTTFPLRGSHLAVPCIACHRRIAAVELPRQPATRQSTDGQAKVLQFRFAATTCRACHGDPHRGEVERFVAQGGCESCHSVESWRRVAFDHERTGFPLRGRHREVACGSCHTKVDRGTPRERIGMTGLASGSCADCHRDPHAGQFARAGRPAQCQACHSVEGWRRLAFDHDRDTRFKLEGAHRRAACAACHRPEARDGRTVVRWVGLPTSCESCHGGGP